MGEFPSGQRGQTVNLLLFSFGGPNPPSPTKQKQTIIRWSVFVWDESDNRTIFAQQKHGSPKQPQRRAAAADCVVGSTRDFPLNARGVRKMRERTVPTLALICPQKCLTFGGISIYRRFSFKKILSLQITYSGIFPSSLSAISRPIRTPITDAIIRPRVQPLESPRQ